MSCCSGGSSNRSKVKTVVWIILMGFILFFTACEVSNTSKNPFASTEGRSRKSKKTNLETDKKSVDEAARNGPEGGSVKHD